MIGKQRRLNRLFNPHSGKSIVVPLDHGMTMGPIAGIEKIGLLMEKLVSPAPNVYVLHKGELIRHANQLPKETSVLMHLSASIGFSPNREEKILVGSVEEAVRLGADGVSMHINIGCNHDRNMLLDAGKVSEACMEWGMPLLIMIYPQTTYSQGGADDVDRIGHCIRICEEIGADLVKVPVPAGEIDRFLQSVEYSSIPVLAAGGEQLRSASDYINQVKRLMQGNIAGICAGRNVFQNANPSAVLAEMNQIVHGVYTYL